MTFPARFTAVAALLALAVGGCGGGDGAAPQGQAPAATSAQAQAKLPPTFVGIVAPEVLPANDWEVNQALDAQAKAGITLFRQPFLWQEIERRKGTYTWRLHDRLVLTAARHGITVMPIVFGVPPRERSARQPGATITDTTTMPPRSNARFAAYAAALVKRYGRGGELWAKHPKVKARPVTAWQVWNEPNLPAYWGGKPDAAKYAALLKTTAAAIRAEDPEAEILTGGLPNSKIGQPLLPYVRDMVKAGAAGSFDTLAVHPYAEAAADVLSGAEQARAVAVQAGAPDDIRVWITEIGWATGGPGSSFTVSEAEQATLVVDLFRQAAAKAEALRLEGVVYYAWRDSPVYPGGEDFWGLHTGLVKRDNTVKPSLDAFAKAVKGLEG